MISRTAEYALRAVVYLAAASAENPSQTVGQIAAQTHVPEDYLAKVLQTLGRLGLITSQRGAGGGFRLARPAQEVAVYEVINAVDPLQRILICPLGLEAHGTHLCPLHQRLDDAMSLIEEQFRNTTIAELLETPPPQHKTNSRRNLCVFPLPSPPPHP